MIPRPSVREPNNALFLPLGGLTVAVWNFTVKHYQSAGSYCQGLTMP